MYRSCHWVGNMDTYSSGPQVLQGQSIYQVVGKSSAVPQVQQAVQSNASITNVIPRGYQYIPANNVVTSSGLNRSVDMPSVRTINEASYVAQGVDNQSKVLLYIHNPGYRKNTFNINHVPGNKQRDQLQNLQLPQQGMSNAGVATITTEAAFTNPNIASHPAKGTVKIPEPTHVILNTHVNEKVGSLKIHISESFLPWNITNKTVLDLEFMRHLFNISGVDVVLTDTKQNWKGMRVAVEQLLYNKVLSDWLVLKCEEKEIPFLKVNNQVEIYTASNFTALLNVITQETCLPLPYITGEKNYIKYLYLNFPKTGNDKVKKLNTPIFHVADDGKKRLLCKYPGIRLDCNFENGVDRFTIHVHPSALLAYETSLTEIRQHLIYRHIIWGFLQMWIRRVKEQYNQCFKIEDIAKNLSLCKAEFSKDGKSHGSDNGLIYDIGYLNCYLKFDPVTLKETKASFSLENFSTKTVCNLSIVQYYKQFFLINDMHYSDALKNTVLFFQNSYDKNFVKANNYVGVSPRLKSLHKIPRNTYSPQLQHQTFLNTPYEKTINPNLSANRSGSAASHAITVGSVKNDIIQVGSNKTSTIPVSVKPRLKARTVEEINSSVDLVKRNDLGNSLVASNLVQVLDSTGKDKPRLISYTSFISLIQRYMENCFALNRNEISSRDESNEREVINRRFNEAVERAVGAETVESFIEKIYVYLQIFYTNSTCQNILKKMIWRAIEAKYPDFKKKVSTHVATIQTNKDTSFPVLESDGLLNRTGIGNNENSHLNDIHTSSLALQSDITTSDSGVTAYSSGGNDQAVNAVSEEGGVTGGGIPPFTRPGNINEQDSPAPLTGEKPNERNASSSISPAYENSLEKTEAQSKEKQSKEKEKQHLPYINTLTLIRVSTTPNTFRICSKSRINSETQSTEVDENQTCSAPEEVPTVASDEISETDRVAEEQEKSAQTVEEVDEECPRQKDYSEYNLKPCSVVLNSNAVEMYIENYRKRKRREAELEESDVESDSDYVPRRARRRFYAEDSDDSELVTERKRIRRTVSEIQYMEARTRVLQRLRKRKSLYVGYERTRISGEELDSFFIRRGSLSRLNHPESEGDENKGESDDGEGQRRRKTQTEKTPAIKELRVVLVRLEDTPEFDKYRERLFRKENWNPAMDYLNRENFSQVKRKYFEVREGKLYLREEYHVKNGEIIPTGKEVTPMRPKREPESPARETDFDPCLIKREGVLDENYSRFC